MLHALADPVHPAASRSPAGHAPAPAATGPRAAAIHQRRHEAFDEPEGARTASRSAATATAATTTAVPPHPAATAATTAAPGHPVCAAASPAAATAPCQRWNDTAGPCPHPDLPPPATTADDVISDGRPPSPAGAPAAAAAAPYSGAHRLQLAAGAAGGRAQGRTAAGTTGPRTPLHERSAATERTAASGDGAAHGPCPEQQWQPAAAVHAGAGAPTGGAAAAATAGACARPAGWPAAGAAAHCGAAELQHRWCPGSTPPRRWASNWEAAAEPAAAGGVQLSGDVGVIATVASRKEVLAMLLSRQKSILATKL